MTRKTQAFLYPNAPAVSRSPAPPVSLSLSFRPTFDHQHLWLSSGCEVALSARSLCPSPLLPKVFGGLICKPVRKQCCNCCFLQLNAVWWREAAGPRAARRLAELWALPGKQGICVQLCCEEAGLDLAGNFRTRGRLTSSLAAQQVFLKLGQ